MNKITKKCLSLIILLSIGSSNCMHRVMANKSYALTNKKSAQVHNKEALSFEKTRHHNKHNALLSKFQNREKTTEEFSIKPRTEHNFERVAARHSGLSIGTPNLVSTSLLLCLTIMQILGNQQVEALGDCCFGSVCGDCNKVSELINSKLGTNMKLGTVLGGTINGIPTEEWTQGRRERTPEEEEIYRRESEEREREQAQRDQEREERARERELRAQEREREREQREREREEREKAREERARERELYEQERAQNSNQGKHKTKCSGVSVKLIEWGSEPADAHERYERWKIASQLSGNIHVSGVPDCEEDEEVDSRAENENEAI